MSGKFFLPVRDAMTCDPVLIDGMATVAEALAIMKAKNISSLVVDRRDERDEYGLLLVSEIAREVVAYNRPVTRTNVYEVMIKPAPALDADMNIKYAIRHMSRLGLTHCLVLHGRTLLGLITLRDMAVRYFDAEAA
jgi:CBS domain-containing protein